MTATPPSKAVSALIIESESPEQTLELGRELGRLLDAGDVIGLAGDLGAGKTQLVRGIAAGLDIDPDVIYSPTFTLVAEHEGRVRFNHIDLFRLGDRVALADGDEIGLAEYLDPPGVTAVEWYEKLATRPQTWTLEITIEVNEGERRGIQLSGQGPRGAAILSGLRRSHC